MKYRINSMDMDLLVFSHLQRNCYRCMSVQLKMTAGRNGKFALDLHHIIVLAAFSETFFKRLGRKIIRKFDVTEKGRKK